MHCRLIQTPPDNMATFVDEILPEYDRLYGPRAAMVYQAHAAQQLSATIAHPDVRAFAVMEQNNAQAMLFVRRQNSRCTLSFFHVLGANTISDTGQALLWHAMDDVVFTGSPWVFTDYIPFCKLQVDETYRALDFNRVDRQFMVSSELPMPPTVPSGCEIRAATHGDIVHLARVLFETYIGHAERLLFEEVQSASAARHFLNQCVAGAFGACPRQFLLGAWRGPHCVGLAVGSEVVAGLGFVLHMAVLPSCQGIGLGGSLLSALVARFRERGLTRAGLGVTCTNPATHLYERAGFAARRVFPVYYREGSPGGAGS